MVLREYQQRLIDDIKAELHKGKRSVCAVLGCGGGKSVIEAAIARSATAKGNTVLFLVHRRELAEQIRDTFECNGVDLGLCDIQLVQTAVRHIGKLTGPKLIITDEAHHSAAQSYTKIYSAFPDAVRVGFTATPQRLSGGLSDVFDSMVEGVSTEWLIKHKYLAPYRYYSVKLVETEHLHKRAGEYVRGEVEALMQSRAIYGNVMQTWQRLAYGRKTIIYCASVASSEAAAEIFTQSGIKAAHLDGTTGKIERESIIQQFRDGDITVLVNVDLFGEGFDVPDCECVVLLRPTLSLALHIQQSMRSMRYRPNKTALIIDHVGNVFRHGFPDEPREWSLEAENDAGGKGKNNREPSADVRQCPKCYAAFPAKHKFCPYCGTEINTGRTELRQKEGDIAEVSRETLRRTEYNNYKNCRTFYELRRFGQARGYKFMWVLHKCVELGIRYPSKYEFVVRRYIHDKRA